MYKFNLLFSCVLTGIAIYSCDPGQEARIVQLYPDSVIADVSHHPVGINLDFFMDGGRFPQAKNSVTEAVKNMGMKYLRYPGGEKSDLYMFSVPPYDRSYPVLARSVALEDYPGVITEENTFVWDPLDFDEYMAMCREVNAEPVVVVAADCYLVDAGEGRWVSSREQLIRHAVEWVRYANIKKKYGIRYWMIGNESWNSNNVNSSAEIYSRDVIDFSRAMKKVDPTILIIANGAIDDFFRTVIITAGDDIDRLTVSNYGVYNFYRGYQTYRDTTQVLIWPAITAVNAMNAYATKEQKERLKVIVAEYGSIDWAGLWHGTNDMGHAIVVFDMAGQLLLQPLIEFSCFWNTRWIENESNPRRDHDALDTEGNLYPTGQALGIWGNFLGTRMVKANAPGKLTAYASYKPETGTLFAYIINKDERPEHIRMRVEGHRITAINSAREYFGSSPEDIHPVWQKIGNITPGRSVRLKGTSITMIEMKIEKK